MRTFLLLHISNLLHRFSKRQNRYSVFQKPSAAVIFDSLINDKLQGFSFLPGQFPEHLPGKFTDSDRCGWHISCPLGNVFISQYNIVYIFATFS